MAHRKFNRRFVKTGGAKKKKRFFLSPIYAILPILAVGMAAGAGGQNSAGGRGFSPAILLPAKDPHLYSFVSNMNQTFQYSDPAGDNTVGNGGNVPQDAAAGDFNGDGILDLAVAFAFDDAVRWYHGRGDGTFEFGGEREVGLHAGQYNDLPRALLAHDFDADGFTDLAVLCSGNPDEPNLTGPSLGILYGSPSVGFEPFSPVDMGAGAGSGLKFSATLIGALMDGDDRTDLVVGHFDSRHVSIICHEGRRRWGEPEVFEVNTGGQGPADIAAADVDFDGAQDLVVVNRRDVQVWKGNGEGGISKTWILAEGASFTAAVTGDWDRDGRWDLAVLDGGRNSILVKMGFFNELSGEPDRSGAGDVEIFLSEATGSSNVIGPIDLIRYDANLDGLDDLAVIYFLSGGGDLFLGTEPEKESDPPFEFFRHFPTALSPRSIIARDVNQDGREDLIVVHEGDLAVSSNEDLIVDFNDQASISELSLVVRNASAPGSRMASYLDRPRGLAWDPVREKLWTADRKAWNLVRLSADGRTEAVYGLDAVGGGALKDPADLAVDDVGDIWIADRLGGRVVRWRPDGTLPESERGFSVIGSGLTRPCGIAYDPELKRLLVSDEDLPSIVAFSLSGEVLGSFEIEENRRLLDLAWEENPDGDEGDGRLWGTLLDQEWDLPNGPDADFGLGKMAVYELDGREDRAVRIRGASLGSLEGVPDWALLRSVAVERGGGGNSGPSSDEASRVWMLTDSGALVRAEGFRSGSGGRAEKRNAAVSRADGVTSYSVRGLRELAPLRNIRAVAVEEDGSMLAAGSGLTGTLARIGRSGNLEHSLMLNRSTSQPVSVEGLSVKDGKVYVLDGRHEEIRVYDASGAPLRAFGGNVLRGRRPSGLHADRDHPYFFVGSPGRLLVLNETGEKLAEYPFWAAAETGSISEGEERGEILVYSPSRRSRLFFKHDYAGILPGGENAGLRKTDVLTWPSHLKFNANAAASDSGGKGVVLVGSGQSTFVTSWREVPRAATGLFWLYFE